MMHSLGLFTRSGVSVIDQLLKNVELLWGQGRMVGVSGLVRFSLEYWSAVHFARTILVSYFGDKDLDEGVRKTARLTIGSKTPMRVPWVGHTQHDAYNILTLIDKLSSDVPGTRADYEFLSEASHPNFMQNSLLVMASNVYDNWSNEMLRTHADDLLERTVSVIEKLPLGLSSDVADIVDLVVLKLAQT
jgi:hypothetical protein